MRRRVLASTTVDSGKSMPANRRSSSSHSCEAGEEEEGVAAAPEPGVLETAADWSPSEGGSEEKPLVPSRDSLLCMREVPGPRAGPADEAAAACCCTCLSMYPCSEL